MNAVVLINPKFSHNVGNALRGCAVFGIDELIYTGHRFDLGKEKRLPREERIRAYNGVRWYQDEYPIQKLVDRGMTPICLEVRENSESLTLFEHPENAVYVFGPEDGSVPKGFLHVCHRFVHIPASGCLNLAAAVSVTLYDRRMKRQLLGLEPILPLSEMLTLNKDDRMGLSMCALD